MAKNIIFHQDNQVTSISITRRIFVQIRMSDCCLTSVSYFLSISFQEQVKRWDNDDVLFVLDQLA